MIDLVKKNKIIFRKRVSNMCEFNGDCDTCICYDSYTKRCEIEEEKLMGK